MFAYYLSDLAAIGLMGMGYRRMDLRLVFRWELVLLSYSAVECFSSVAIFSDDSNLSDNIGELP